MTLKDAQNILQKPRLVNAFYVKLKDTRLADRLIERAARLYPENVLDTPVEFSNKQQAVAIMEGMASVNLFSSPLLAA